MSKWCGRCTEVWILDGKPGLVLTIYQDKPWSCTITPRSLACPEGKAQCVAGRKACWTSAFRTPPECTFPSPSRLSGSLRLHQCSSRCTFPEPLKCFFSGVPYLSRHEWAVKSLLCCWFCLKTEDSHKDQGSAITAALRESWCYHFMTKTTPPSFKVSVLLLW